MGCKHAGTDDGEELAKEMNKTLSRRLDTDPELENCGFGYNSRNSLLPTNESFKT
jgi:hypothetical protein